MKTSELLELIINAIEDAKGINLITLDVRELTDVTDYFVVVTGSSTRHSRAIMNSVLDSLRDHKCRPIGVEGEQYNQWILLDYTDVVVHIMLTETREFYDLERHWEASLKPTTAAVAAAKLEA